MAREAHSDYETFYDSIILRTTEGREQVRARNVRKKRSVMRKDLNVEREVA